MAQPPNITGSTPPQSPPPAPLTESERTALTDLYTTLLHAASRADLATQHTQRGYRTRQYQMQASVLRGFASAARKHLDGAP